MSLLRVVRLRSAAPFYTRSDRAADGRRGWEAGHRIAGEVEGLQIGGVRDRGVGAGSRGTPSEGWGACSRGWVGSRGAHRTAEARLRLAAHGVAARVGQHRAGLRRGADRRRRRPGPPDRRLRHPARPGRADRLQRPPSHRQPNVQQPAPRRLLHRHVARPRRRGRGLLAAAPRGAPRRRRSHRGHPRRDSARALDVRRGAGRPVRALRRPGPPGLARPRRRLLRDRPPGQAEARGRVQPGQRRRRSGRPRSRHVRPALSAGPRLLRLHGPLRAAEPAQRRGHGRGGAASSHDAARRLQDFAWRRPAPTRGTTSAAPSCTGPTVRPPRPTSATSST